MTTRTPQDARAVLGRVPPHAEDAEKAMLGSILVDNGGLPLVKDVCPPTALYIEAHRAIFEAMLALDAKNTAIDSATLAVALKERGQFDRVGGAAYLDQLIDAMPIAAQVEAHAAIIVEKASVRRYILDLSCAVASALEGADPIALSAAASDAATNVLPAGKALTPEAIIRERLGGSPLRAIRLPIASTDGSVDTDLGDWLGDLFPGQKVVVAARTSEGKTALMRMVWLACAAGGIPAAYLSLEDSAEEITCGAAGGASWLSSAGILGGRWSVQGREEGERLASWFGRLPFHVEHRPGATRSELATAVRSQVVRNGARVVIVDYIQAVASTGRENRASEIGSILSDLSRAAHGEAVIVVGSQVRRRGKDAKEDLSLDEMKESGRLEEDAKAVLMLRRVGDDWKDAGGKPVKRGIAIQIAKNKFGRTGTMPATLWLRHTSLWPGATRPRFDLAGGPTPPPAQATERDDEAPPAWVQQELPEGEPYTHDPDEEAF